MTRYEMDGYIIHNTKTDKIVKMKHTRSLDVVYMDVFWGYRQEKTPVLYRRLKALEKGMKCRSRMETFYDKKKNDRFIGNIWKQIKKFSRNILGKDQLTMKLSR
ncbi:hypothetical protein TNIN_432131 [Trichonephila inaurata madagascariensis]|uniref:Uncharacterized protein n=1 Tax=Trichonephila inaurata madagascariensis TaxID=2747483 RepID=A0A8X6XBR9_9ARAC|nr:hypothetical protein TNIN_432131 [Trichonephila inaurata madagascariensis]